MPKQNINSTIYCQKCGKEMRHGIDKIMAIRRKDVDLWVCEGCAEGETPVAGNFRNKVFNFETKKICY